MHQFLLISVLISLPLSFALFNFGENQAVRVNGTIYCDGKRVKDVRLKLYDQETFKPDDLLAETKTDADGEFDFEGHDNQRSPINPKLNIYHSCGTVNSTFLGSLFNKNCYNKISFPVSQFAIINDEHSNNTFVFGDIKLNSSEKYETDCFN